MEIKHFDIVKLVDAISKSFKNTNKSRSTILNELLLVFVVSYDLNNKYKDQIALDKTYLSKILNHKLSVHRKIVEVVEREGVEKRIRSEFESFYQEYIACDEELTIIEEIADAIQNDNRIPLSVKNEIRATSHQVEFFLKACIIAVKMPNTYDEKIQIWKNGNRALNLISDDLFAVAKRRQKKIVVIPVDTTFETELTKDIERVSIKLVSENSLHGKWLGFMALNNVTKQELDARIQGYFVTNALKPIGISDKQSGKTDLYPIGTIVVLEEKGTAYYLLAIADFNSKCKAETTERNIAFAVERLVEFYDENGQGYPMYIPLLGTGLSRSQLTQKESYDLIRKILIEKNYLIHGEVNIVAYGEAINELKVED